MLDRWVPQSLTDYHNTVQEEMCSDLLSQYVADGARLSSRLVTGDETWTLQFTIQTNKYTIYTHTHTYILYTVSTATIFYVPASSSRSLILWQSRRIILPADDAGASKHGGIITIYIYIVYLLVWIVS